MPDNHLFLIPGFFGFTNLGELTYFGHVQRLLRTQLKARGLSAQIHVVATLPTATLPLRAQALHKAISERSREGDRVHLIGHSTGGLDARLLVSPNLVLPSGAAVEDIAARVQSVLTLTTPHHGTPSAAFLSSVQGKPILKLLSLMTLLTLRQGRLPLRVLLKAGECVARARERATGSLELVDELYGTLLGQLSADRRQGLEQFLREVSEDQSLLTQLTPDAMELFNATTPDRAGVAYGSVVARARRPMKRDLALAVPRPYRTASQAIFRGFYALAARGEAQDIKPPVASVMLKQWADLPRAQDNDGMVPTHSQVWGQVLRAVTADHLDVLGHYADPQGEPPHYDWLISGSGFRQDHFVALWEDALSFLHPQMT
ncbi:MAG: triacylglycerol lipase [Myxococcota bacterium]|nr:triacylglycerol lipase [Myxococcota bacterium]